MGKPRGRYAIIFDLYKRKNEEHLDASKEMATQ